MIEIQLTKEEFATISDILTDQIHTSSDIEEQSRVLSDLLSNITSKEMNGFYNYIYNLNQQKIQAYKKIEKITEILPQTNTSDEIIDNVKQLKLKTLVNLGLIIILKELQDKRIEEIKEIPLNQIEKEYKQFYKTIKTYPERFVVNEIDTEHSTIEELDERDDF
ncbi:MAG: hypothetical protein N2505_00345 [Endomicrobia bacterium]|nr:hypothetical protein [Endomicrobiia bacterium]